MPRSEPPVLYAVELTGCTLMQAFEADAVMATFAAALTVAGATVVQSLSHHFPGAGQTCDLLKK